MDSLFEVKDLNFVISGGLGQIGMKLTEYLEKNNSNIVIIDKFDQKKIKKLKKQHFFLNSKKINFLNVDISKKKKVENSVKKILTILKKVSVLVNLAAIDANNTGNFDKNFNYHDFPEEILKSSIDVNLMGTINTSQVFCKYFLENKLEGNIINVASVYSIVAPNLSLYNENINSHTKNKPMDYVVSKSSIPNITKYIATNYAKYKIRCNCLIPHGIKNSHSQNFIKKFSNLSPLGRMSDVEEIVGPIVFLSTKASSYMTGATLIIDGGWTAW